MIRPIHLVLAAAMLVGKSQTNLARWEPDPRTNGTTERYVPDGYNCDGERPWNHCRPLIPAVGPDGTPGEPHLFAGPAYQPQQHHLPTETIAGLSILLQHLKAATWRAESLQKSGNRQDLAALSAEVEAAQRNVDEVTATIAGKR